MLTSRSIMLILLMSLFLAPTIYSQEIKFSGYGAAGYRIFDRDILNQYNQEAYYEGKFQADIEINDEIEAQLDFRATSFDEEVELREFSVKFDYNQKLKFKFGNIKKPFGLDQLENRADLPYIERSQANQNAEEMGFGGRSLSLMAYYKYSRKRPEYPYSYYASIFRNNSQRTGIAGRFSFHSENWHYGANYMLINSSHKVSMFGHGIGLDVGFDGKDNFASVEVFLVQNIDERLIRSVAGNDESINVLGFKTSFGFELETGAEVIKKIEPLIMGSIYFPELSSTEGHAIQALVGANFYFHKNVRLRFNADLRLSKNQYIEEYTTKESRGIIELQVRF
ncbi:MAG: hypothetical protein KKA84_02580 [Bacteroidetes bacterium]|nr:hypothetical protein [Bacteroidota bacterium]